MRKASLKNFNDVCKAAGLIADKVGARNTLFLAQTFSHYSLMHVKTKSENLKNIVDTLSFLYRT